MLDEESADRVPFPAAEVVDIKEAAAKKKKEKVEKVSQGENLQLKLDLLLGALEEHLDSAEVKLGFGDGAMYLYNDGVWRLASTVDREDIDRILAKLATNCGIVFASKRDVVHTAIKSSEKFRIDPSKLNHSGRVVFRNATLHIDEDTTTLLPHSPDDMQTRRVDVDYNSEATCPGWLEVLDRVFSDRPPKERADIIAFLQEWFGLALCGSTGTPRQLRKVLFLYGPPRTGKSTILDVLRRLLGTAYIATGRVKDVNRPFGLETFMTASAWISEEVEGLQHLVDASRIKAIVTGEPLSVPRKYATDGTLRFSGPVAWSSNAKPNFSDGTSAVYDRILLLNLERQFSTEESVVHFGRKRPEEWLEDRNEYPGIVNWALEGYQRVMKRGQYEKIQEISQAGESWREQNDPLYAFARDCCESAPGVYNSSQTLVWAAIEYIKANDNSYPAKFKTIQQSLKQTIGDVMPVGSRRHRMDDGVQRTVLIGVRLNERGLRYLARAQSERDTVALDTKHVNVAGWEDKTTQTA